MRALLRQGSYFVEKEMMCMKNNDYGLLYDAAVAWKELTEYYYVLTFGYKQQLYTIYRSFPIEMKYISWSI